jgi:hypothetical protein
MREVNFELLFGRDVVDANGKKAGRIEEIVASHRGGEMVVTEFHLGSGALAERLFAHLRKPPKRVKWGDLDLSDPDHPRLR